MENKKPALTIVDGLIEMAKKENPTAVIIDQFSGITDFNAFESCERAGKRERNRNRKW